MFIEIDKVKYKLIDMESLFIVSPHYEHFIWDFLTPAKNDVFIDIGAHIGKYSLKIAKHYNSSVIAIEPNPETYQALEEGIRANGLSNVKALNVAAFDKEGILSLYLPPINRKKTQGWIMGKGWTTMRPRQSWRRIEVQSQTLDQIAERLSLHKVDWMKIDVEGAEYEVLKGAKDIIERHKPQLIIECTRNRKKVFDIMKKGGYNTTRISPYYYHFGSNR